MRATMVKGLAGLAFLAATTPWLTACQSPPAESPPASAAVPAEPAVDPAVEGRARRALTDAGVADVGALVSAKPAQWNDSSLGCRQPGMQYMQVITDGHVLQFRASGDNPAHEVHVANDVAVVCSGGTALRQRQPGASRALNLDVMVSQAREDLAKRLGLNVENVALRTLTPMTWKDDRLGCEAEASASKTPPVMGQRLLFGTTRGNYIYHTDGERFAPCPDIADK